MTILGGIWDKWASEDSIINTANRVRICSKISTGCKLDCSKGSSDNADPSSPNPMYTFNNKCFTIHCYSTFDV